MRISSWPRFQKKQVFLNQKYCLFYEIKESTFWKYFISKDHVVLDTFLDFADVSSQLTFKLSAWERDYTISFELQIPNPILEGSYKVLPLKVKIKALCQRVLLNPPTTDPPTTVQPSSDHLLTDRPTNRPPTHRLTDPIITETEDKRLHNIFRYLMNRYLYKISIYLHKIFMFSFLQKKTTFL